MASDALIAVLDVGKTLAKLSLWTRAGELVARRVHANQHVATPDYPALDVVGVEAWMVETLTSFSRSGQIEAIVPVGHGAAAAIIRDNRLAAAPIDYECVIPDREGYESERDSLSDTGSPALPAGLNLGAQLHYLEQLQPDVLHHGAQILLWPQYWAWRLSGVAASEVTSLGCHTDLWRPTERRPSALARRRGWAECLAPLRRADAVLGRLSDEWIRLTGLPADVQIYCGVHDSNAALLAARGYSEIAGQEATVMSTGTWFVAMRSPADDASVDVNNLPYARDCLVNVDIDGKLVPSSRFMGGREIELLCDGDAQHIVRRSEQCAQLAAVADVVRSGTHILPAFAAGVGPFPHQRGRWVNEPSGAIERHAAISLYAALVADVSLDLIGAKECVLLEGRFGEVDAFARVLATLRPRDRVYTSSAQMDVSYGALRLIDPNLRPAASLIEVKPLDMPLHAYRERWLRGVATQEIAA